jgi:hypothetical protein
VRSPAASMASRRPPSICFIPRPPVGASTSGTARAWPAPRRWP